MTLTDVMKSLYFVGTKVRSELKGLVSHNSYDGIDNNNIKER